MLKSGSTFVKITKRSEIKYAEQLAEIIKNYY